MILNTVSNEIPDYENNDKNILKVEIHLPTGEIMADGRYGVILTLSKGAIIGLGTELIREAINKKNDEVVMHEIFPSIQNNAITQLGIFYI